MNETALLPGFYVGSFVDVDDDFGVVVCGDSCFFDGADGPYVFPAFSSCVGESAVEF